MRPLPAIATLGVVQIGGLVGRFVLVVVIARLVTQEEFGRYSALWGVTAWTSILIIGGWSSVALAQIPKSGITKVRLSTLARTVSVRGIVVALVQVPLVLLVFHGTSLLEGLLLSGAVIFLALATLTSEVLRSQGAVVTSRVLNMLVPPVVSLVALVILLWVPMTTGLAILITGLGWAALAIVTWPLVTRRTTDRDNWTTQSPHVYMGIKVAQAIMSTGDVLIVALLAGYTEAALYSVANRVAVLGGLALNVVTMLFGPRLSAVAGDSVALRALTRRATILSVGLTLPVVGSMLILRNPILAAFGDDYGGASSLLVILVLATTVNALFGPVGTVLNVNGQERVYRKVMIVGACCFVPGVAVGAHLAGGLGAAIVFLIVNVGWNVAARIVLDFTSGEPVGVAQETSS